MFELQKAVCLGRRALAVGFAAMALPVLAFDASAQDYPNDTIEITVAYAPGGSTDLVARALADELGKVIGAPVIVENKPGGGTLVGTQYVANAKADGYRLLFGTNALVINSLLQKVSYDPVDSFADVGIVTTQSLGVIARPDLPVNSVKELIEYAKARPGELNFASSGNGSNQHMAGEQFKLMAGVDMLHVPYGGAGPALTDLLGGRVDLMFTSLYGITDYISSGKLKLIATTGETRSPATPDTSTVIEGGLPGFTAVSWQALFAPADTPESVIAKLNKALVDISTPELAEKFAAQGLELKISAPAEANTLLVNERDRYNDIIKSIGSK
ncbi:Bug family tripartite tricarboxylate transporter substrate binding protein [Pseudorhizobium pelagicum]|uniref:LacI family transcriptional regulator n=1 Tax=Pseudorhizobium pelagicum TaxID=1509405 RepID=A0A922NZQ8_9HYPH|nr:tripartite tricarboxylate transporter substrate binding protein [Pseudorhizobium pelagicum]KEQ03694.1 hypothetical protein GV67_12570 [Pseudorhizobium pelagicum]KEQ08251.1 hypothetical protein GV68_02835 [Pseudorhizobium pelagicum]